MDIQNALKLLDLEPGATLEDARDAFKKKAKQFHPDKLMAVSGNRDDCEKMKDINLAYHTLKETLKPATRKKPVHRLPDQFFPTCRNMMDMVLKWISNRQISLGSAPPSRPGTSPGASRTSPGSSRNSFPGTFEDVLKQSMHRRMANEKNNKAYARYLELERKMNQARKQKRVAGWEVDNVEPITRIKPIK